MKRTKAPFSLGYTLLETIVVIAIGVIIVSIAVANFGPFLANQRTTSIASSLRSAIQLARNEAIRIRVPVQICPIQPNSSPPVCSTDTPNDWSNGWMVYVPSTSTVVRRFPVVVTNAITPCFTVIQFNANGRLQTQTNCNFISNPTICPVPPCNFGAFLVRPPRCTEGVQINIEPITSLTTFARVPCS